MRRLIEKTRMRLNIYYHLYKTVIWYYDLYKTVALRESKFYRFDMALYNYIISASCELKGVSFQKLVLPHDDIGHSLHTFLKGGYISEALPINKNPNNWV